MNIGFVTNSILNTTHQGHAATGLQPNATPVNPQESLTRVNPTQNTSSSAESKADTKQSNDQASQQIDRENAEIRNTKDYKEHNDKEHQQEHRSADNPHGLDDEDLKKLEDLKQRDREVRAHEAAHMAAAGQYAQGGITYTYKKGPDGVSYAVGGEVSIDTSAVPNDPQATIRKANRIKAAALAPADPSSQDKSVAAEAAQLAVQARQEITKQRMEEHKQAREELENKAQDKEGEKVETQSAAAKAYAVIEGLNEKSNDSTQTNQLNQVA